MKKFLLIVIGILALIGYWAYKGDPREAFLIGGIILGIVSFIFSLKDDMINALVIIFLGIARLILATIYILLTLSTYLPQKLLSLLKLIPFSIDENSLNYLIPFSTFLLVIYLACQALLEPEWHLVPEVTTFSPTRDGGYRMHTESEHYEKVPFLIHLGYLALFALIIAIVEYFLSGILSAIVEHFFPNPFLGQLVQRGVQGFMLPLLCWIWVKRARN